jgi:hypothetical protein
MGYPLDDPQGDVHFPQRPNATSWGFQEEQNIYTWAERVSSLTSMSSGLPSARVGATRTASGQAALMNEGNLQVDVLLDHFKAGYQELLGGMLADIQERIPEDLLRRVLGADAVGAAEGLVQQIVNPTRFDIAGRVDFYLLANSNTTNREAEKQNAILLSQLLMNPINLQMGIVQPHNIYAIMQNILRKHGIMNVEELISAPVEIGPPMGLDEEFEAIRQGVMPRIVLNDQHDAKVEGLMALAQSEPFQLGVMHGVNASNAMALMNKVIGIHQNMADAVKAQAAPANTTGLQLSPTTGARMAGSVGETGQPIAREASGQGQVPPGQAAGGAAGAGVPKG